MTADGFEGLVTRVLFFVEKTLKEKGYIPSKEKTRSYLRAGRERSKKAYEEAMRRKPDLFEKVNEWKYDSNNHPNNIDEVKREFHVGHAVFQAKTNKSITSLEEAIDFFQVDTDKYEVERWIINSWDVHGKVKGEWSLRTNYQVKVWLKERDLSLEALQEAADRLISTKPKMKLRTNLTGRGHGVVVISDIHVGAKVQNLLRTQDFSLDILVSRLAEVAEIINSRNYKKVSVIMLGDLIDSFTGINHPDVWRELEEGAYGYNLMIIADRIFTDFFNQINNLEETNNISGNHDRATVRKENDQIGEIGGLFSYMLGKSIPELKVNYHPYLISRTIDGINYIMTHGDKGLSKKDTIKIINDYGDKDLYNLLLEGHLHTRKSERSFTSRIEITDTLQYVSCDEANYRKVNCPSIYTGNTWSERLGFSATSGFLIIENNGKGKPNVSDYSL